MSTNNRLRHYKAIAKLGAVVLLFGFIFLGRSSQAKIEKKKTPQPTQTINIKKQTIVENIAIKSSLVLSALKLATIGHYDFENVQQQLVIDFSHKKNNARLLRGRIYDSQFNKSLYLNGQSAYMTIPHSHFLGFGTNSFTLEIWMQTKHLDLKSIAIVNKVSPKKYSGFSIFLYPNGKVCCEIRDKHNHFAKATSKTALSDNTWHQIVMQRHNDSLYLYIDTEFHGQVDASKVGSISNNNDIHIGEYNNRHFFRGLIDNIRIYNRKISSEEINMLYWQIHQKNFKYKN